MRLPLPSVVFLLLACLGSAPAAAAPIDLTATMEEMTHGEHVMRKILAVGKTRFPNGTRLAVGLRQRGEANYLMWYNAVVRDGAFQVSLGPFRKPLSAGSYMVEAWYSGDRQPRELLAQIKTLESGDPSFESAKDADGNLIVMTRLEVGTKEEAKAELESFRTLYLTLQKDLKKVVDQLQERFAQHQAPEKQRPADATPEGWRTRAEAWTATINDVDRRALDYNGTRSSIVQPATYKHLSDAVLQTHDLLAAFGERIDSATYGLPSRDPGTILRAVTTAFAGMEESLKPRTSDADIPPRPKKKK